MFVASLARKGINVYWGKDMSEGAFVMNIWFVLATCCGVGTAVFSYIGTQQQSGADSKQLEEQFSNLGERITDMKNSGTTEKSELDEINEEYAILAEEYNKSRYQKAAKLSANKSGNIASQLAKTQSGNQNFKELHKTTLKIVAAYNEQSDEIKIDVQRTDAPENLFLKNATENVYIALRTDSEKWIIRPYILFNEIGYQIGRLNPDIKDYKDMSNHVRPLEVDILIFKQDKKPTTHNNSSNFGQEYMFLTDDIPNVSDLNSATEHLVRKLVELMLLPSITE